MILLVSHSVLVLCRAGVPSCPIPLQCWCPALSRPPVVLAFRPIPSYCCAGIISRPSEVLVSRPVCRSAVFVSHPSAVLASRPAPSLCRACVPSYPVPPALILRPVRSPGHTGVRCFVLSHFPTMLAGVPPYPVPPALVLCPIQSPCQSGVPPSSVSAYRLAAITNRIASSWL